MLLSNRPYYILEGNIGAGKSTFLKMLANHLAIQPVQEPCHRWQNVAGNGNILQKFYQDPSRWAYTFQTYAFITRIMEAQEAAAQESSVPLVLERSVYTDYYCFANNAFQLGFITALEWQLYQEWFTWLVDGHTRKPDGFIYIKTDPNVCYQRLKKRARSEEQAVDLDYLIMIHEKHEQWLVHRSGQAQHVPVLVLECNQDFEADKQQQEKYLRQIHAFFNIAYRQNIKQKSLVKAL